MKALDRHFHLLAEVARHRETRLNLAGDLARKMLVNPDGSASVLAAHFHIPAVASSGAGAFAMRAYIAAAFWTWANGPAPLPRNGLRGIMSVYGSREALTFMNRKPKYIDIPAFLSDLADALDPSREGVA